MPATGSCVVGGDVLQDGAPCESAGVTLGVCHVGVCQESTCGDGVIAAFLGESCDDGAANSDVVPDACRSDCTSPRCGDGVTDKSEACDTDVGLGGICVECERLLCRPDTANCNLEGADGCECAPPVVFDGDGGASTLHDGRALVLGFAREDTITLEELDLETGRRDVLREIPRPADPFFVVDPVVVDEGLAPQYFVNLSGDVARIDDGALAIIRTAGDQADKVERLVAYGGTLLARTSKEILRMRPDGSEVLTLADTREEGPADIEGRTLTVTPGGDVAFLHQERIRRVRIDGSEATPRENPVPVRWDSTAGITAIGEDVLTWDLDKGTGVVRLLRLTATEGIELAAVRLGPPNAVGVPTGEKGGRCFAVDGATVFASTSNVDAPARSRVLAVPLTADPSSSPATQPVQTLAQGQCVLLATAGRVLYAEATRFRLLTVGR